MPQIIAGNRAPDFTAREVFGASLEFTRPHATPHVLIVFLRYAGCPYCNLALHRLSVEYPLLRKNGCEVIVVVQSTAEKIQKNIYARHKLTPPFHIVPDLDRRLYGLYGVTPKITRGVSHMIRNVPFWISSVRDGYTQQEVDGSLFIVPAFFLIDEQSRVELVDYAANFYDDSTFTPIYEHLTFSM